MAKARGTEKELRLTNQAIKRLYEMVERGIHSTTRCGTV
jgi:hypothetical protein